MQSVRRLEGDALVVFLELAMRGYTVRRIRQLMYLKGFDTKALPDALMINTIRQSLPALRAQRDELDGETLDFYGLSDKMERVRRLCEVAEALEGKIRDSPQWAAEYRRYLEQIQREIEPLGIEISFGDPWAKLLQDIASAVDKGHAESESRAS